jgi:hypothetical protein
MSLLDRGRRPARRAPVLFAIATLLVVGGGATPAGQAKPVPEAAVKAAFVLRFPEFVVWPTDGADARPIVVCLSPSHTLGTNLPPGPAGQHPYRVTVRQLQTIGESQGCDAVYLTPTDVALLDALANKPVLTLGDHPGFCQRGGIINLLVIDGRVRFEINLGRARRAGLRIDSQLLRLATKVYGGEP